MVVAGSGGLASEGVVGDDGDLPDEHVALAIDPGRPACEPEPQQSRGSCHELLEAGALADLWEEGVFAGVPADVEVGTIRLGKA